MEWIEAALAFAVVMMLLSTAVTILIDTVYHALRIREKGLKRMVEGVYEDVLVKRLPKGDREGDAQSFVETITRSRFTPVSDGEQKMRRKAVKKIVNAKEAKNVSTLEFVERLAETSAGRELYAEAQRRGGDFLDVFLTDLASKYEDFCQSSVEYFARRAKFTCGVVAVILAFALNINAVHLFQTLLQDKEIRQQWIDRGDEVAAQVKKAEERLDRLVARDASPEEVQKRLDENAEELKTIRKSLESSGIPIGWNTAPWVEGGWAEKSALVKAGIFIFWSFSVLLAGLLIGLGGPFWYKVFNKLGELAGMVRGMQTTVQKAKELDQPAKKVDTNVFTKVFEIASRAQSFEHAGGRVFLTPDGQVDRGDLS